nr:retrovirus-related Pol polyprotein from transposon TNT 1-94 [Tanacetum cinerariifolium]
MMNETSYELLKNEQKKQLGKNNEAMMTLYSALPRKEYEREFMCKTTKDVWYTLIITHQDNDGVASKTTKEMVKSLALKAKVTREQTSDDSDRQRGSDEDVDEEKEAEAFTLMARNFCKFFCKGNRFGKGNQFGNSANRFGRGRRNSFRNNGGKSSKQKGACYNCKIEGHFASECRKPKENKAFVGGAWSDSKEDEPQNDETCLMAIDS